MGVNVEDGLPGAQAGVEDDPVSRLGHTLLHGDGVAGREQVVGESVVRRGERGRVLVVGLRNHEDVGGGLGIDVAEGQRPAGLENDVRRNLLGHNLAEQAVGHERKTSRWPLVMTVKIPQANVSVRHSTRNHP